MICDINSPHTEPSMHSPTTMIQSTYGSLPHRESDSKIEHQQRKQFGETLLDRCVDVIAENLLDMPVLEDVPKRHRDEILRRVTTDTGLHIFSIHVHSEAFWKRCCLESKNWNDCVLSEHGFSWKQAYFERNLQSILENFDTKVRSEDELAIDVKSSRDYIFSLTIKQMLSHPDLHILFDHLHNLTNLTLTYGVKRLRLRYNRALFGMKLSDAESLSSCLRTTSVLCHLGLPCNAIDDDLLEVLVSGLKENETITHLDLSHNKITDVGVQILSEVLSKDSIITTLNLSNNHIQKDGGRMIGHILGENRTMTVLNLSLNRLGDVGASALFKAIGLNDSIIECNVSGNSIGYDGALVLANSLRFKHSVLRHLDVSANDFTDSDLKMLCESIEENFVLKSFDARMNKTTEDGAHDVTRLIDIVLRRNNALRYD